MHVSCMFFHTMHADPFHHASNLVKWLLENFDIHRIMVHFLWKGVGDRRGWLCVCVCVCVCGSVHFQLGVRVRPAKLVYNRLFLVGSLFWRFSVPYRNSATFLLYYSIQTTTTIPA